jgi:hypothetical protein
MQNIGLDGQETTVELLALCTVLSMLHWTDLRSALAQAVKHNQPAEKCCRQAARQSATKYLQCLQYQLCALSAWSLLSDSGIRDAQ